MIYSWVSTEMGHVSRSHVKSPAVPHELMAIDGINILS